MKHKLFKIALSETHKYAQLMHTSADRLAYTDVSRAIRESAQFKGIRSADVQTLAESVVRHLKESVMSEIDLAIRDAKEDGVDDITIARELAEKYGMRLPDAQRFVAQWTADNQAEPVTEATSALAQWKQKVKAAHPTATFEVRKKTDRYGSDRVEANVGDRMVGYFEKKSGRSNVLEATDSKAKIEKQIAKIDAQIETARGRLDMAAERRRMAAQKGKGSGRIQSDAETKIRGKIDALNRHRYELKDKLQKLSEAAEKSMKVYHVDRSGKKGYTVVDSAAALQDHIRDLKRSGAKITHTASIVNGQEGPAVYPKAAQVDETFSGAIAEDDSALPAYYRDDLKSQGWTRKRSIKTRSGHKHIYTKPDSEFELHVKHQNGWIGSSLNRPKSAVKKASSVTEASESAIKPGDKIRTIKMGQIPGVVEKIDGDWVFFRHESGKLYRAPLSNVRIDESLSGRSSFDRAHQRFKHDELAQELKGEDQYYQKMQAQQTGKWYIRIDGRVWRKNGQPVEFNGRKHATTAAVTIQKRSPGKIVTLTTIPTDVEKHRLFKEDAGNDDSEYQTGLDAAQEILRQANQEYRRTGDRSVLDRAHREYGRVYDQLLAANPEAHSRHAAKRQVWGPAGTNESAGSVIDSYAYNNLIDQVPDTIKRRYGIDAVARATERAVDGLQDAATVQDVLQWLKHDEESRSEAEDWHELQRLPRVRW